jgi:exopolyphosphatase/guanosine-5'-triphosphate,3'-diphosphate pyrophosphatase
VSPRASSPVAVIDIGSNTIKGLVAERAADGGISALKFRTVEARISTGISGATPRLGEAELRRGLEAIQSLLADAQPFSPARTALVATSAVRDAGNGAEFRARVRAATGHDIRILTGEEEAGLIGRGLTCDPALRHLQDFYVFDLGGGSLECLAFRGRRIEQAISVQLGCVRLTEKFVGDPSTPLATAEATAVKAHVRETLAKSGFGFTLPSSAAAVATGGTITTARNIFGAREGKGFAATSPDLTTTQLRKLLAEVGSLPLAERKTIPGLTSGRADVFPVALVTFLGLAEAGQFSAFVNSVFSLRYGLADELLSSPA